MTTTRLLRFRPSGRWAARGTLLLVAAIAAACSGTPGDPVEAQVGPYALTAHLNPDPPKQSGGTLHLQVRNAQGDPVTDADVTVGYFMPAMGTMAEMKGNLDVEEDAEGVYLATLDLPMAGSWRLDVSVAGPTGRGTAAYRVITGSKGLKVEESSGAHSEAEHGAKAGDDVAYYTCSMHPSVKSEDPGTCPICSMDLVPVTEQEAATATIRIDPARRQEIGVTTERVTSQPLSNQIRAVGTVVYDETRLTDVTLKITGWIGDLEVNEPGQYVRKGQTLFTLYSPELYATQEELLTAVTSQRAAAEAGSTRRVDYLVNAARKRLRLWDLSEAQIDRIVETGERLEYLPIVSPASGYVVEKNVVAGAAVRPAERLFRIAAIDRVWVEAEVYESELPLVEVGQRATVTLPYAPGQVFTGKVSFIYPFLQGATRTGTIRVELPNPELVLKPDMYANVTIGRDLGDRLTVPEQAILYAGERSFVFLDLGDGRLRPKQVKTGLVTDDRIEVLSGLNPGDVVVTSGNFLVAAEARLKMAMEQWQ